MSPKNCLLTISSISVALVTACPWALRLALAHEDDAGSHQGAEAMGGPGPVEQAGMWLMEHALALGGLALLALLGLVLAWSLYRRRVWTLGHSAVWLGTLIVVGGLFALTYAPSEPSAEVVETFGPGMDPLHMRAFYANLGFRHARRLPEVSGARTVSDIVGDPAALPPPLARDHPQEVHLALEVREVVAEVAEGILYYYWTYNERVPGPILRVREGDTVVITLRNHPANTHDHSIDLHAVTGPGGGGALSQVVPGAERTFRFKALHPGFYVYHCATENVPTHIAHQLFGGIIVEPEGGLPPVDREFAVFQGELYTAGGLGEPGFRAFDPDKMLNETPTYYTFNGKPRGVTGAHGLRARVGETIRIYFANLGVSKTSALHLIGEVFDRVYSGEWNAPVSRNQETTSVAPGQGVVVELRLEVPGEYVLVDHALARMDRGAWGVLHVEGEPEALFEGEPPRHNGIHNSMPEGEG